MTDHDAQPLEPSLERAKTELRTALDEACSADIEGADTGELIRVEEVLAIANEAAKAAVSVRRRLSRDRSAGGRTSSPISSTSRELLDGDGVRWSVFEVHP